MKKTALGVFVSSLFIASAFAAPRTYSNKHVTNLEVSENDVVVTVEAGELCGGEGSVFGKGCRPISQMAHVADGPNKTTIIQLLIAAFTAKTPLNIDMEDIKGETTILRVSGTR